MVAYVAVGAGQTDGRAPPQQGRLLRLVIGGDRLASVVLTLSAELAPSIIIEALGDEDGVGADEVGAKNDGGGGEVGEKGSY